MADKELKIIDIKHPSYESMIDAWEKYRLTYDGGDNYIEEYLISFSERETTGDFEDRKTITYIPAYAKSAIVDIKNAIYQRMNDITREGGSPAYQIAITGANGGVDRESRTMDDYIGNIVLPELLTMKKVAVFIDKPDMEGAITRADTANVVPYMYEYRAEEILSWSYGIDGRLSSALVKANVEVEDPITQLIIGSEEEYRHFLRTETGVDITAYDKDGELKESIEPLELPLIPIVIFEISQSLLTDVANHQIALLNLASSDMNYAIKSNFPFYTEQFHAAAAGALALMQDGGDSESTEPAAKTKEIEVGATKGRAYAKGLDRPKFIHPSSDPLVASMNKQEQIKREVRQLINLSLQNLEPKVQAADSKEQDNKGLEAGLSYIGLELARGEREIAEIWAMYDGSTDYGIISYPKNYSLRTDDDRRAEAKELREEMVKIPSVTYQRTIAKDIVTTLVGHKIGPDTLKKIHAEIDSAIIIDTDPKRIREDHEEGLVGDQMASELLGYPPDEYKVAQEDKQERAKMIALAQSSETYTNEAARGNPDGSPDPKAEAELEKSSDLEINNKQTRGEAK